MAGVHHEIVERVHQVMHAKARFMREHPGKSSVFEGRVLTQDFGEAEDAYCQGKVRVSKGKVFTYLSC